MSKPTYSPVTTFEEEEALREIIEALRAENGKLLRGLLKTLSKRGGIDAKHFAEFLVHHPNLRDLVPQ